MDKPLPAGASAAIGSFDGVHIGHQHVIESAIAAARANGAPSAVICFDPHPQTFFHKDGQPFRLMTLSQQLHAFESLGIDYTFVLRFDGHLSSLSAEDFARLILHDTLQLSHVSAGFDFQFGKRGGGHAADLVQFGAALGFSTDILPCQTDAKGNKLSSSAVREALLAGDVATATAILGRPQAYSGEVVHGAKQGRTIDFPTLNLRLGDYQRPRYGIYVTRTTLPDGRQINGVSNIGVRPTVGGNIELLETYLFDFSEDVYGQEVETSLLDFIRPEAKFESFEAMKLEIQNDAAKARAWFKSAGGLETT
ncbi:bifunctional riboflavin kinase/FAD synthetase [Asticcacaulis sp. 201]|uniref:bifunctional riboflavin kinase/FAD synthetase n=1 Tax=Asticcacaulis sp. 201 TaxID=3028787 RepID=UPI002915E909|nr:bifunctional riboflavin kinase/FAD synthetase [Asticcacaulis sp. 201]MDV6333005.1 bifunctional riboflavin kinase/FAD synthetase [Asticcacaulis sp. 201]